MYSIYCTVELQWRMGKDTLTSLSTFSLYHLPLPGLGIRSFDFRANRSFLSKNERMSDSLKKNERFTHSLIFGERNERFAHITHFW